MKIGFDLSPLQGPHKMRGIGAVVTNILNNLPDVAKNDHNFVFYMKSIKDESYSDYIDNLIDTRNLKYEVRIKPSFIINESRLPQKLRILSKMFSEIKTLYSFWTGVKGYEYKDLDIYIHTDQMEILPKMPNIKKIMIAYDIIPYILESDYLWNYSTARKEGLSLLASLGSFARRKAYIYKIRINAYRIDSVLAISKTTRSDFIKVVRVNAEKIFVWYLGIDADTKNVMPVEPKHRYMKTSWGNIRRPYVIDKSRPYLLFVGGTDSRRKLDDLAFAFNQLRAQGLEIQLFFSGDILRGADDLPVLKSREALLDSSYKDDIVYFGFTSEEEKRWLYENSLAFIYPSVYEGFGLPVLEAMINGAPVITYKNSSIYEIAGNNALYANDGISIKDQVKNILNDEGLKNKYIQNGKDLALIFSWENSMKKFMSHISKV